MNLGLLLGLQIGNLSGELFKRLFEDLVRFQPYSFTSNNKTQAWNKEKFLIALQKYEDDSFVSISDTIGNIMTIGKAGVGTKHISIKLEQKLDLFLPSDEFIYDLIKHKNGLVYVYMFNADYVNVQSEVVESTLLRKAYSKEILDTIKTTPVKEGVFGRELDTRFNPGRKILLGRTYLLAAWKMWFGEGFFEFASKESILSFPYAYKIEKMESGIIFVQLFENIEDSYTPDGLFRQWKWQEWINFDSIIEKFYRK